LANGTQSRFSIDIDPDIEEVWTGAAPTQFEQTLVDAVIAATIHALAAAVTLAETRAPVAPAFTPDRRRSL
jgi:hypothetical protein